MDILEGDFLFTVVKMKTKQQYKLLSCVVMGVLSVLGVVFATEGSGDVLSQDASFKTAVTEVSALRSSVIGFQKELAILDRNSKANNN